jgi:hypothetical protein
MTMRSGDHMKPRHHHESSAHRSEASFGPLAAGGRRTPHLPRARRARAGAIAVVALLAVLGAPQVAAAGTPSDNGGISADPGTVGTTTSITSTTVDPMVGQAITIAVSVAGDDDGAPTGSVTVSDGGSQSCVADLIEAAGSCDITETSTGIYSFSAGYGGDSNYATSSTSASSDVTVVQDDTTTAITGTTSSPVVGQPISVGVSVSANSPGAGTPTGSATVSDGGSLSCVASLSDGAGSCEITETAAGPYEFTASYGGDDNDAISSTTSTLPVDVAQDDTTTAITNTTSTFVVGQPITVDVSVGANSPGSGTPTGSVTVSDGGSQSCVASLSDGAGSCEITETAAGPYSLTASYGGDDNNAISSTSTPFDITVSGDATTTAITNTTSNPVVGQPITVDVSVGADSPGAGTPTGSVTVSDGGSQSCVASLSDGAGSCEVTETVASSYSFSATYGGDSNDSSSATSSSSSVVVGQDSSASSITETTPNPVVGQPITVDVSVGANSPGAGTPTGSVTVSDGGSQSCVASLSDGAGSCEITETAPGPYGFSASYGGDANYTSSSTSSNTDVTVGQDATATAVTNTASGFVVGEPITVDVSVGANTPGEGTPTGSVTVSDGASHSCVATLSSGAGNCEITETSAGPYGFTAGYGGDANDASSSTSTPFDITVSGDATTTAISSTTSSPVVGQPITVDVSVGANSPGSGTPTGSVTVSDGASHSCIAGLSGGSGSCEITETATGSYSFSATYGGDSNDASSSTSAGSGVTVGKDATSTAITSTTSNPVVGQPITVDVSVGANSPGSSTPTGSMTVSDGGSQSCIATLSGGTGSCEITETTSGSYSFSASYGGGSKDSSSATSSGFGVTVGGDATATAITGTTSHPVVGQPITVSVSVSARAPGAGTPTGSVTVSDGGTHSCIASLGDGSGSCEITETTSGSYSFSASYGGDSNDASSVTSSGLGVTIGDDATATVITGTTSHPVVGQPITVNVSVSAKTPGGGTPTGSVTVGDGGSHSCVASLSAGTGSCQVTETASGSFSFSATYGGDSNDASSGTSSSFGVTIGGDGTATLITSTTASPVVGQPITVGVSVGVNSPGSGTATGSVTVSDGGSQTCVASLSAGTGSCQITETAAALHSFTATYSGDRNDSSSVTLASTPVTVGKATSVTHVTLSSTGVTYGDEGAVTLSVDTSPEFAGSLPTGSVTVDDSTTALCVITLSAGRGSCTLSASQLGAGSYRIVATYGGSSDFDVSTSGTATLVVGQATSRTTVSLSSSATTYGDEGTVHASVTVSPQYAGSVPSGTVTVDESTTALCVITLSADKGSCTLSATRLGAGTYRIVATYAAGTDFASSTSGVATLTIGSATSRTALSLSTPTVTYGDEQAARISVTVSPQFAGSIPAGTVSIVRATTTLCVINLSSAKGSCTLSPGRYGPEAYHLVAYYNGSSDFRASVSGIAVITVVAATTRASLSLSISGVTYGNEAAERFSVTVSPEFAGTTPTGSVTVNESSSALCAIVLSSDRGSCTLPASRLPAGTHAIVAYYLGSIDFRTSATGTAYVGVAKASSGTGTVLSTSRVTYGDEQGERVSVKVSPEFAGTTPTGTVTVMESTTTLCVIGLSSGGGSCTLSAARFGSGSYQLVAHYGGSGDFNGSASGTATFTVSKASSSTFLHMSSVKVNEGDEEVEHLSVSVSSQFAGYTPTGTVTVTASGASICVISLSSGGGSCGLSPSRLAVGVYQVAATYNSNSDFNGSTSAGQVLTVKFVLSVG